jgi:hypothetical protein
MKWLVLRCKSNFLYRQLFSQQIGFYFPTRRVKAVNPRSQKIKPYFPDHLFVHVDKEFVRLSALSCIPGANGLVKFGRELAEISTHLLTAIKQRIEKINTDGRAFVDNLRFSIDEIPQLYNVMKGEMSLVRSRRMMIDQIKRFGQSFETYTSVRLGLTRLWQVSGRNTTTFQDRANFDRYYVHNWSVWLDLYILARTIWVVLSRDGAY